MNPKDIKVTINGEAIKGIVNIEFCKSDSVKDKINELYQMEIERQSFLVMAFGRPYNKEMEKELHFLRNNWLKQYQKIESECKRLKQELINIYKTK